MTVEYFESIKLLEMKHYGFGPDEMKKIKVCKVCGASVAAAETVCSHCGEALPYKTLFDEYKSKHAYCANCDTVVATNARFCPQCGKRILKNLNNKENER